MTFAENLKQLRLQNQLTQKILAEKLDYSQSIICDWEKGLKEPTANAIKTIANFFHVTTDYLLGYENDFGIKDNEELLTYSADEIQLITTYREMSRGKKQALFSMLDIDPPVSQTIIAKDHINDNSRK